MLRNIGQLLALVIVSQIAIAIVMAITGLSYHQAGPVTFAFLGGVGVILVLWFVFRIYRTRARVSATMENIKRLQAEQEAMIPQFRKAAERLADPEAKAEVLEQLAFLARSSKSL